MNKVSVVFVSGITLLLAACNTTIYPEASGGYSSVTTSTSLNGAESNARQDIEAHCKKIGKSVSLNHHEAQYHGSTAGDKIVGGLVGGLVSPGYNPAISDSDYVVRTRFICR